MSAAPVDVFDKACSSNNDPALCNNSSGSGLFGIIRTIIQVMLIIGGIMAVIMIILGGIRYTTSNGDQADVKAAKRHDSLRNCWARGDYFRVCDCDMGCWQALDKR